MNDLQMWSCDDCGAQRQWGHNIPKERTLKPLLLCWRGLWSGEPGECGDAITEHTYVGTANRAAFHYEEAEELLEGRK